MTTKTILKLLDEPMRYLSNSFSRSIYSPVYSKEDLYNDLVILFLEKRKGFVAKKVAKKPEQEIKNYWFRIFKNYLINKHARTKREREIITTLIKKANEKV